MSERIFRFIQGIYLFVTLALGSSALMYGIIIMYLYEGITNLRLPIIISKLRYGNEAVIDPFASQECRFKCDAERIQRLLAAVFLYVTFFVYPEAAWFGPWFLAAIFLMAGITNMCPSVMFLRWVGFR